MGSQKTRDEIMDNNTNSTRCAYKSMVGLYYANN